MNKNRKILRNIWTVLVVISFTVTFLVGAFLLTNYQNVTKMLQVATIIKTQYLKDVPLKQMLGGAVRGMVESLNDPYSVYMDQKEYREFTQHIEGSIGGIGVSVGVKENKFIVFSVIKETPAARAGVEKGDIIFKVNDTLTSDMDIDETVNRMRGEPGTQVEISVLREGAIKEFTIIRDVIIVPTVESEVLDGQLGYLQLNLFASNSDEALASNLQELLQKKIKGLILDLRDNPGGDLVSAVNMAKYFLPDGPVVYIVDKNGETETMTNKKSEKISIPLVVLINGGSASASEVLAGAIKDLQTGILVGEKSFGKALVQVLVPMLGGDAVKLTTAKYLTPNKVDIQAEGIHPDIEVILTAKDQEDTQLKKAIEVLQEQIKLKKQ